MIDKQIDNRTHRSGAHVQFEWLCGAGTQRSMIVKLIEVHLKPEHLEAFLASQEIWNREMRKAPGFLGCYCGQAKSEEDVVHLIILWRSNEDYETWMLTEHDRIAKLANSEPHYKKLTVRILEPLLSPPQLLPAGFLAAETLEAADVQIWSEAYRATFVLRTAVKLRLFNELEGEPRSINTLAQQLGVEADILNRLLRALSGMDLVQSSEAGWTNKPLASRTLVEGTPAYQGDMILHNSRPDFIRQWLELGEEFGLPPDTSLPRQDAHELFIRAMNNTAKAGQAEALCAALELSNCKKLIDIGGGSGVYSLFLCRQYPDLHAIVLDLPETEALAKDMIATAGLSERVQFVAQDYRTGQFPGSPDVVLLSNILRSETAEMIVDLLQRIRDTLQPGGIIVIQDLFPEPPPASTGLSAGLFGLQLLHAAPKTLLEMTTVLQEVGFSVVKAKRLPRSVVMNGIIIGRIPISEGV